MWHAFGTAIEATAFLGPETHILFLRGTFSVAVLTLFEVGFDEKSWCWMILEWKMDEDGLHGLILDDQSTQISHPRVIILQDFAQKEGPIHCWREVFFANWSPACRILTDNVTEWYSLLCCEVKAGHLKGLASQKWCSAKFSHWKFVPTIIVGWSRLLTKSDLWLM